MNKERIAEVEAQVSMTERLIASMERSLHMTRVAIKTSKQYLKIRSRELAELKLGKKK